MELEKRGIFLCAFLFSRVLSDGPPRNSSEAGVSGELVEREERKREEGSIAVLLSFPFFHHFL